MRGMQNGNLAPNIVGLLVASFAMVGDSVILAVAKIRVRD